MAADKVPKFEIAESAIAFAGFDDEVAEHRRQHLALLGAVAASWALFESIVDEFILELGCFPIGAGRCLTAQLMGPASRLNAYIAIARLKTGDDFAGTLEKFAKDTTGIAEQRNRVIHDPWKQKDRTAIYRHETTARKYLRHEMIAVSLTDIDKLIKKISAHIDRFRELAHKISKSASA